MLRLPPHFAEIILAFAPVFVQQRTWRHAQLLLLGALLAPGHRTVSSFLRIIGLRWERHFVNYHRVLNRAIWNSRQAARLLLDRLINRFVSNGPIVLGVDDTIERRRGKRISAKGIYRDPDALVEVVLRKDQRPALAQLDATGADSLSAAGLGEAGPRFHRLCRWNAR